MCCHKSIGNQTQTKAGGFGSTDLTGGRTERVRMQGGMRLGGMAVERVCARAATCSSFLGRLPRDLLDLHTCIR